MNILLWAPFGCGTHYWGPGRSAFNLYSTGFPNSEHKLFLAHGYPEQPEYGLFENQFLIRPLKKDYLSQVYFILSARRWLKKNHHKFDVMHALGAYEYSLDAAYQFFKFGKPSFVKITGEYGGLFRNSLLSRGYQFFSNRKKKIDGISGLIAISEKIYMDLINAGFIESNIFQIPNGVNTNQFIPANHEEKKLLRRKYRISEDSFIILFLGGISERKRTFDTVIAVNNLLDKKLNDVKFLILGPDRSLSDMKNKIENYIKEKDISEYIKLVGHIEQPIDFLRLSDVFILATKTEGMSNALLEALACGLGAVVSPASGNTDLVKDNFNGFYTNEAIESISNGIMIYYNDRDLINVHGKRSRELIANAFSSNYVLKSHLKLFDSYVNKQH